MRRLSFAFAHLEAEDWSARFGCLAVDHLKSLFGSASSGDSTRVMRSTDEGQVSDMMHSLITRIAHLEESFANEHNHAD